MPRHVLIATMPFALLTACANHTFAPGPGKSAFDYDPDSAQCRLFARGANPAFNFAASGTPGFVAASSAGAAIGYGIATAIRTNENYNDCMQAIGWRIADGVQPTMMPPPESSAPNTSAPVFTAPLEASSASAPSTQRHALGVAVMPVPYEMTGWLHMESPTGLFVLNVETAGVAAAAGLRPNDVLLTFADEPLKARNDIKTALASVHAGEAITVEIWRDGKKQSVNLEF